MKFLHNESARIAIALSLSVLAHIAILTLQPHFNAAPFAHQTTGKTLSVTLSKNPAKNPPRQSSANLTTVEIPAVTPRSPPAAATSDTHYFNADELDQTPYAAEDQLAFSLPDPPKQIDIVMRLWIDKSGKVVKVEPVTAELSQAFISEVRSHLMNSRFSPGHRLGYPANSVVEITLHYE